MRRGVNAEGASGSCSLAERLVELELCADTDAAVQQINAGLVQVDGNIVAGNIGEEGNLVEVQRHRSPDRRDHGLSSSGHNQDA